MAEINEVKSEPLKLTFAESAPIGKHTSTLFFIHGLGDRGSSWVPAFEELQELVPGLRVVCPDAPIRPVTVNGGRKMPSWFDIVGFNMPVPQKLEGLEESMAALKDLINAEIKAGIPSERIILGGFSQGAGVSMRMGYQLPSALGGVVALSGRWLYNGDYSQVFNPATKQTPCFIGHLQQDLMIKVQSAHHSKEQLEALGVSVTMSIHNGAHHTTNQEMLELYQFIQKILNK